MEGEIFVQVVLSIRLILVSAGHRFRTEVWGVSWRKKDGWIKLDGKCWMNKVGRLKFEWSWMKSSNSVFFLSSVYSRFLRKAAVSFSLVVVFFFNWVSGLPSCFFFDYFFSFLSQRAPVRLFFYFYFWVSGLPSVLRPWTELLLSLFPLSLSDRKQTWSLVGLAAAKRNPAHVGAGAALAWPARRGSKYWMPACWWGGVGVLHPSPHVPSNHVLGTIGVGGAGWSRVRFSLQVALCFPLADEKSVMKNFFLLHRW